VTPDLSKADLRRRSLALRATLAAQGAGAAEAVARRLAGSLGTAAAAGMTIAGYVTIGSELDSRPALETLAAAGATLVLPVTAGQGQRLQFRVWRVGEPLERGPFGTSHPCDRAAVLEPAVVLVPLLAFDRSGRRLGYGAGYYDRTLQALRQAGQVTAIGLAFDGQEVAALPDDPNDQPLDRVVTETRTLDFAPAAKVQG
jgi:5-formyltetrahydrofolate cyclo-ligase